MAEAQGLPREAFEWLQAERLVVLASASAAGEPATHVVSWALAVDERTVRMAVRHAAPTVAHVRETGRLAIELIGDGLVLAARGGARVVREEMTSAPRGNAMVELEVEEVVNHLPRGLAMRGPRWEIPAERAGAAADTAAAVFAELRAGGEESAPEVS